MAVCLLFSDFLFFYWFADHRDLHSFPTRRSSDLPRRDVRRATALGGRRGCVSGRGPDQAGLGEGADWTGRNAAGPRAVRSEEHTSELQSRVDLVCRLLLEKKKKQKEEKRKLKQRA